MVNELREKVSEMTTRSTERFAEMNAEIQEIRVLLDIECFEINMERKKRPPPKSYYARKCFLRFFGKWGKTCFERSVPS